MMNLGFWWFWKWILREKVNIWRLNLLAGLLKRGLVLLMICHTRFIQSKNCSNYVKRAKGFRYIGMTKHHRFYHLVALLLIVISLACGFDSGGTMSQDRQIELTAGPVSQKSQTRLTDEHKIIYYSLHSMTHGLYAIKVDGSGEVTLVGYGLMDNATFEPAWSPDGARVLFASERDGNDEILMLNLDDLSETNLTNHPADERSPAWSSDGSQIAFCSDRVEGNEQIFVMNTDGSNVRQLTFGNEYSCSPTWSPDDTQIAYTSKVKLEEGGYRHQIFVMNANGSDPIQLTHTNANHGEPAWSPNGTKIAFTLSYEVYDDIYVMNADGSNPVNLTNSPDVFDESPVWSPDGIQIAFVSDRREGNYDIYLMSVDGSGLTPVTKSHWYERTPDWRP